MITIDLIWLIIGLWLAIVTIHAFYYMYNEKKCKPGTNYIHSIETVTYKIELLRKQFIMPEFDETYRTYINKQEHEEHLLKHAKMEFLREIDKYIEVKQETELESLMSRRPFPGKQYLLSLMLAVKK